jgi:hypothetical protein
MKKIAQRRRFFKPNFVNWKDVLDVAFYLRKSGASASGSFLDR